jgi:hypothetical protein
MEWLVRPEGGYLPLTTAQALRIDSSATLEDVTVAIDDLRNAIAASRSLVADSRGWRRMRNSGLRSVVSED